MIGMDLPGLSGTFTPITLALLVGVTVLLFVSVPLLIDLRSGRGRVRKSMIERHRNRLKAESMRRVRAASTERSGDFIGGIARVFALLPNRHRTNKIKLLRSAGFADQNAIFFLWGAKLILPALLPGLPMLYFLAWGVEIGNDRLMLMVFVLAGAGFWGPEFCVRWARKRRLRQLERGLPDGLDLLVICAEAGLSLDAALRRVADEFVSVVPELSEELLLTSIELNFLPDRRQALTNLAQRADLSAFRGVATTLVQTEKYGTPLAQALRALASEFRDNRLLQAEEKAARLPAILTVPMIVFILPTLFIVIAAPAFIRMAEAFSH